MDIEYLDKAGLNALWTKIKNTFVAGSTYSSRNQTVDNRLTALEARVAALEAGSGGSSGGGSTPSTPTNIPTLSGCSVSGNNAITVTGVSGEYTLAYIDSNGNILSNYENITI